PRASRLRVTTEPSASVTCRPSAATLESVPPTQMIGGWPGPRLSGGIVGMGASPPLPAAPLGLSPAPPLVLGLCAAGPGATLGLHAASPSPSPRTSDRPETIALAGDAFLPTRALSGTTSC